MQAGTSTANISIHPNNQLQTIDSSGSILLNVTNPFQGRSLQTKETVLQKKTISSQKEMWMELQEPLGPLLSTHYYLMPNKYFLLSNSDT